MEHCDAVGCQLGRGRMDREVQRLVDAERKAMLRPRELCEGDIQARGPHRLRTCQPTDKRVLGRERQRLAGVPGRNRENDDICPNHTIG